MIYENYKELLYAIFFSDIEDSKKSSIICVYDTQDSDRLIAVFNSLKTCANFFNTSAEVISSTISRKALRNKRFRIERLTVYEVEDKIEKTS